LAAVIGGVPLIGNVWGDCDPQNPRNRRTRGSILVEEAGTTILVDTSPDMRQQLLTCGLKKLDAVLFTHSHADHCHGIDELRSVNWLMQKPIDIYADAKTMIQLTDRFGYVFRGAGEDNFYKPSVTPHEISGSFTVGNIAVLPFFQNHGTIRSMAFVSAILHIQQTFTISTIPPWLRCAGLKRGCSIASARNRIRPI